MMMPVRPWSSLLTARSTNASVAGSSRDDASSRMTRPGSFRNSRAKASNCASPADKPVASDLKALIGKTVVFRADRIEAPAPLGCRKPHYEIKQYDPDMLFQGSLTRPKAQATTLGFADSKIPTLETGCEGAIDFHFAGSDAAMFALNNRIYKMVRAKPAGQ